MILSANRIRELILTGGLKIEPLIEEFQIGASSFDVRAGSAVRLEPQILDVRSLNPGESVQLEPSSVSLFSSLETIELPSNVCGLLSAKTVLN